MNNKPHPRVVITALVILAVATGCTGQQTATQAEPENPPAHTATPPATPSEPTAIPRTPIATTDLPQEDYDGPHVTLLAAGGQMQAGGLGLYCVASPTTGSCANSPITLPSDPIVLEAAQEATFRTAGDFDPVRLTLYVFENGAGIPASETGERVWAFDLSQEAINALRKEELDPTTETTFDPQLEPGEYLLILNGLWSQGEQSYEATFGFNVSVSDS